MSVVHGKEALLREAEISSEHAQRAIEKALGTKDGGDAASLALISIACSARELVAVARLALHHLTEKKP